MTEINFCVPKTVSRFINLTVYHSNGMIIQEVIYNAHYFVLAQHKSLSSLPNTWLDTYVGNNSFGTKWIYLSGSF